MVILARSDFRNNFNDLIIPCSPIYSQFIHGERLPIQLFHHPILRFWPFSLIYDRPLSVVNLRLYIERYESYNKTFYILYGIICFMSSINLTMHNSIVESWNAFAHKTCLISLPACYYDCWLAQFLSIDSFDRMQSLNLMNLSIRPLAAITKP